MIKADAAISKIRDILREESLDEDIKLEKIYEIVDDVEDNDAIKTTFAELRKGQRLFELCGGAGGFGVLMQVTTFTQTVHHHALVESATMMLKRGKFWERTGDVNWQRVTGGTYD